MIGNEVVSLSPHVLYWHFPFQDVCESFAGCNYYTFSAADELCELFENCPTTSEEGCSAGCVSSRPGCEVAGGEI